jgi:hypothetical protein
MSSEAKNLEAISRAIDDHNRNCDFPAVGIAMNPFEVERLGWDSIRGLPIRPDANVGTGTFRVICGGDEAGEEEQEVVEAVAEEPVEVTREEPVPTTR